MWKNSPEVAGLFFHFFLDRRACKSFSFAELPINSTCFALFSNYVDLIVGFFS